MLQQTGERQVATSLDGIKPNHRNRYQFAIDKILGNLRDSSKQLVLLDAACGIGYGTAMIADAVYSTAIGIDVSEEAISEAIKHYKRENNDFMVVDLSDSYAWPFSDSFFDAIISIETIEHIEDAESLIARFSESTNFLIASVPNQDIVPFDKKNHPFHFRHYTKGQFETLLNDYGFKVECWATQYDKIPGIVYSDADDGMGFIVSASR